MSLSFPTTNDLDFWKFYKENRQEIDRILWSICWKHKQVTDPREMFNELIVRLHRSDILKDFNPKEAQLHTYFTNRANFYARHIVTKEVRYFKKTNHRVLCQGLNTLNNEDRAPELIAQTPDIEQDISIQELIEEVKKKCSGNQDLIRLLLDDMTWPDIAANLGCSLSYVRTMFGKMKNTLRIFTLKNKDSLNYESMSTISFDNSVDCEIEHEPQTQNKHDPKNIKTFISSNDEPRNLSVSTITNPPIQNTKEIDMKNKTQTKEKIVKAKNNHAIAKVRPLNEAEVKKIRNRFIALDGVIPDDTWAKLKETMSKDVSVFQITGQVVRLHRAVARGEIALKNKKAYNAAIQARRDKWKTYDSAKYREFAKRTAAKAKKTTAVIVKRVKASALAKKVSIKAKARAEKTVRLMILFKNKTFNTKIIKASKAVSKTDIPKLLNWKTVPKNVSDYMVMA
jgi:hypothetical protein